MSDRTSNVLSWIASAAVALAVVGCVFVLLVFFWKAIGL